MRDEMPRSVPTFFILDSEGDLFTPDNYWRFIIDTCDKISKK